MHGEYLKTAKNIFAKISILMYHVMGLRQVRTGVYAVKA
jgi:hypothetical protein